MDARHKDIAVDGVLQLRLMPTGECEDIALVYVVCKTKRDTSPIQYFDLKLGLLLEEAKPISGLEKGETVIWWWNTRKEVKSDGTFGTAVWQRSREGERKRPYEDGRKTVTTFSLGVSPRQAFYPYTYGIS
ncbi:hypothetical protein H2199_009148 [Coniosporium tulheliwenetii]|uniref:Uncharacterized protein n=1 Tax=Coniosporium tulheliwenetii TaxID=3383036 RepID=A0ACC2YF46_9PEZI|nr:hypothetical protein H2199_009148 [Cladosporium sp. JES 115]